MIVERIEEGLQWLDAVASEQAGASRLMDALDQSWCRKQLGGADLGGADLGGARAGCG